MSIQLKPCPFCGHEGKAYIGPNHLWSINCSNVWECAARTIGFKQKLEAVDKWNHRYVPPLHCSHCNKQQPATHNTEVGMLCDECYQDAVDGGL